MFLRDDVLKCLFAMQLVSSAFAVLALISFVQMHRVHNSANFSGGRQIRGPMAGVYCGSVCCGLSHAIQSHESLMMTQADDKASFLLQLSFLELWQWSSQMHWLSSFCSGRQLGVMAQDSGELLADSCCCMASTQQ